MREFARLAGVVGAVLGILLVSLPARASAPLVVHLRLEGVINPIKARYVQNALEQAQADGAGLVLLSINTPGGLVSSMQDIIGAISNSSVPVVGLVEPRTAQATSAGAFILLATDVAGMLPDTRVGAAHPVGAGEPLKGAVEEKATNSLVSLAKSLAARRGRPLDVAEGIVRESISYTATEAKQKQLVELIVDDKDDFLRKLDGLHLDFANRKVTLTTRGATVEEVPMSAANHLLDALADPTIASILVSIGVMGIIYELSAPGIGLGGIVGVTSLLLGLLAMSALPLKLTGVLLLLAGLAAIGLEVFTPTHGAVGAGGVVAMGIGAIVLVDEARYFGSPQKADLRLLLPLLAAMAIGFANLARVAMKARRLPPQSGVEAFTGMRGVAKETFTADGSGFSGSVFVDGARWQAVADSTMTEGDPVQVVAVLVQPTRLRVKRLEKGES